MSNRFTHRRETLHIAIIPNVIELDVRSNQLGTGEDRVSRKFSVGLALVSNKSNNFDLTAGSYANFLSWESKKKKKREWNNQRLNFSEDSVRLSYSMKRRRSFSWASFELIISFDVIVFNYSDLILLQQTSMERSEWWEEVFDPPRKVAAYILSSCMQLTIWLP